jgi:hypothetical protein
MPTTVQIHVNNEDPIVAEIESLPDSADTLIVASNPRMRDGKDVRYLAPNVTMLILPVSRINFIQVLPSGDEEKVIGFVRD